MTSVRLMVGPVRPARCHEHAKATEGAMNFDHLFEPRLKPIQTETPYRVFADLERRAGHFPQAFDHRLRDRVTVWCSNDYLGMGQHPVVLDAMIGAVRALGAGSGGTRNIAGNTYFH